MKRVLSIVSMLALLALLVTSGVSAKVIGNANESACNAGDGSHPGTAAMWGEINYHGYGGNLLYNGLFYCGNGGLQPPVPDLYNVREDTGENCRGFAGFDSGRFADCISSIQVDGMAGYDFCIYTNPNYTGYGLVFTGNGAIADLSATYEDRFSSMRWVTDGNC